MAAKRFVVRKSKIHGRGVFALTDIKAGDLIGTYRGKLVTLEEASKISQDYPEGYTLFVAVCDDEGKPWYIDGGQDGNGMRFLNHSCDPNCEFQSRGLHVSVYAVRDIQEGQELTLKYNLSLDKSTTAEEKEHYKCYCGARNCRKTMLEK